ncbi:MAG TPA: TraB/GumN family protein [Arenimonas sp.]|nr:TraB/GumN family protein [Arenimonas sp.]
MFVKVVRLTLVLFLAAAAAACAEPPPRPLLWKVSDADNHIYLLGSFHLLKKDDYPLDPVVEAAFADAERLVFELPPDALSDPAATRMMLQAAQRTDGSRLRDELSRKTWERLQQHARRRNLPLGPMQNMDAWYVGLMISLSEMQAQGLMPEHGLDKHFAQRARRAGKPAGGLESVAEQIALFDGLEPELQVASLERTLLELEDLQARVERMHALWRDGDAEGLYAMTGAEMKASQPALYARVNTERNRAWLPRLKTLLDPPGDEDVLVVVGALHLLGDDGLVALFEAEGYTVERL